MSNGQVDLGAFEVQGALRVVHIEKVATGILLRVQGAPSETLQIQCSATLAPDSWNLLATGVTDGAGILERTDIGTGQLQCFYRAARP